MTRRRSPRNRLYGMLRVAKTQLGWSEDEYRAFLEGQGAEQIKGTPSASTLSIAQLRQCIEALKARGFVPIRKSHADWRAPRIQLLNEMWLALHRAGVVHDPSEVALVKWCRRAMAGKQRFEWATSAELNAAVEAIKDWARREGVQLPKREAS